MTIFNKIYLFLFNDFKKKYKNKASFLALSYTSFLQITLIFLSGCFLAAFLSQMNTNLMGQSKAITLFVIISIAIHFSNWMAYGGKTRKVMNAKYAKLKSVRYNKSMLLAIPVIALIFSFILLQSF